MANVVWSGALLLFGTCLAYPQTPSILVQPTSYTPNVLSLSLNTKKYVHTVSDHFLSITLEPSTLFMALQKNPGSTVINMAKGLNPAYIRISGPECNYFRFQGGQDTSDSSPALPIKHGRNITITGWHWSQLNEFIAKTGLDLIVGLNVMNRQHGTWDLSNTVDLLSYSDKHGYNMAFQIGNDIQAVGSRVDSSSLGRDATRLRKVLEAFPRYTNSVIISPDIKSCETQEEARYLKNFIMESGPSLSAMTFQVLFSGEKNVENPSEMFSYVQNQMEARVWQKDIINKYLGKTTFKKPLWIVESGSKDRKGDFTDGLNWAQRLCAGARVGINTIMRKPSLLSLCEPTSDYWVSVLHKALVGSEVLDIKTSSGNKTRLETVAHCTKMSPFDPNEGILAPEYRYNRGAITVFGVNMGLENVKISLKIGEKQSLPLHQYFLTGNNRQNGKKASRLPSTMLNGQKLILSPDGELPIISPRIRGSHQMITVPSQSVFFLVLPDIKSKACMSVQIDESKESYKGGVRIVDQEDHDVNDYDTPIIEEDELITNEKNTYVAFRSKYTKPNEESVVQKNERHQEQSKSVGSKRSQQNNEESYHNENLQQSEPVVKYVTFSNNNWLSKFPKTLNNQGYSEELSTFPPTEAYTVETETEKYISPAQSRREKYLILAQAVAGKRHPEKNVRSDLYPNLDSAMATLKPAQKLKLMKRSVDGNDQSSKDIQEMLEEFTNKENPPNVLIQPNENDSKVSEHLNANINPAIPEIQQSAVMSQTTQQTIITTTPSVSTALPLGVKQHKQHVKIESHVQKIKSRAEQALAKINERTSHKKHGKISQEKFNAEVTNPIVQEAITDKTTVCTETVTTKEEPTAIMESTTDLSENLRYNRQTNTTTTSGVIKTVRPRLTLKLKKSEKNDETIKGASSPVTETAHSPPSSSEMSSSKTTKPKNIVNAPKVLMSSKSKQALNVADSKNGKSVVGDSHHETTQQPLPKLKLTRPVLHPLGKVRTPPKVDAEQVATNEKVTEKLVENLRSGKKVLQSERVVSPIDKNGENKLEGRTASSTAEARIKALEEKFKLRRSEIERRLQERMHKVNRRSTVNEMIEDDVMGIGDILNIDRFGSNALDADVEPVLKREFGRYPRSVADLTVKLNEVNTYLDRSKKTTDPKHNEISEDSHIAQSKDWKNTNDIRHTLEDSDFIRNINRKLKRKSIFEDNDEDDYSKMTASMMTKFFSHVQALWKYLKKTFLL